MKPDKRPTEAYTRTSADRSIAHTTSKRSSLDHQQNWERLQNLNERRAVLEYWRILLDGAIAEHNNQCALTCVNEPTEQHRSLVIELNAFNFTQDEWLGDFTNFEAALTLLELSLSPWNLFDDLA